LLLTTAASAKADAWPVVFSRHGASACGSALAPATTVRPATAQRY